MGGLAALASRYQETFFLRHVLLELTRECDLRCVYCAQSQPDFQRFTLDPACLERAIEGLRESLVGAAEINGHGETTSTLNWQAIIPKLKSRVRRVHLTSNFARLYNEAEVDALVDLSSISVSLDTDDGALLKETRRTVKIETILENIANVRARARARRVKAPKLIVSCVVHDRNALHLERLVQFGVSHGVEEFRLLNLVKGPDVPGLPRVKHPSTMPKELLPLVLEGIAGAMATARRGGAKFSVQSGLIDSVEEAARSDSSREPLGGMRSIRFAASPRPGETRNCLDPWFVSIIRADGTVCPCCYQPVSGSLKEEPLQRVINNEVVANLRSSLVTGDLNDHCRSCPDKPLISRNAFAARVRLRVPSSRAHAAALRGVLSLLLAGSDLAKRCR